MKQKPIVGFQRAETEVSLDVQKTGFKRILQIIVGLLLVAAGIAMLVLPGQGLLTILVGLNLIKPDNVIVRWMRRRIPGIPDEGTIPTKYLVLGGAFFVLSTIVGWLYWDDVLDWLKSKDIL